MYIIFSSNGFAAHLTLAAFRMIMFLRQFYRITFDFLFADATLILKFLHSIKYEIDKCAILMHEPINVCLVLQIIGHTYRKVLGTIWLAPALKKLSRYFLFANTTFEAIFMIKFAKCGHALICNKLFTNATISYNTE